MNENTDSEKLLRNQKRPWDLLSKAISNKVEFEDEGWESESESMAKSLSTKKERVDLLGIAKENSKQLLLCFLAFASILGGYAFTIPSSFYSTLHLYAPEKMDSISSRLSLFTQKVEYASFPVDLKTPISLFSRRLREETAKNWVVEKILADPTNKGVLRPSSVSIETNYVPNQEILVIEGYANSPDLAALATNYYWDFLIADIRSLEEEQQIKIKKWFELTNQSLDQQISDKMKKLETITPRSFNKSGVFKLKESLGDSFTDLELQKSNLERQLIELKSWTNRNDFTGLKESVDPEVDSQLKIYNQLLAQKNIVNEGRVQQGRTAVIETISSRIKEIQHELNSISVEQKNALGQIANINSKDNQIKVASEQEVDLRAQLMTLRIQKNDLITFKSQIEMESRIRSPQFKLIRKPIPNPASIRPLPIVKYGMAFSIALILAFATILTFHMYRDIRNKT